MAVDGKDFLYTVFQFGAPERAREMLRSVFGPRVLRYAEVAWISRDTERAIALCDLAIHDPEAIQAHYASALVLAGRCRTAFRNAFTIALPIQPESIHVVYSPATISDLPTPEVSLGDLIRR